MLPNVAAPQMMANSVNRSSSRNIQVQLLGVLKPLLGTGTAFDF